MEKMKFYRALEAMEKRDVAMRRTHWHNGMCYVFIDRTKGFVEPAIVIKRQQETIAWPYAAQRGDYCADDWYELTQAERDAYQAEPTDQQVETTKTATLKPKKPRATKAAAPQVKPPKPARSRRPKAGTS